MNAGRNYVELQAASNFSFLRGASHPEELISTAHQLGYAGLALTDFNSMAGIVRAHTRAKELEFSFLVGCRISSLDLLAYPTDRGSYGRLCSILTMGKRRAERDECELSIEEFLPHAKNLVLIALSSQIPEQLLTHDRGKLFLSISKNYVNNAARKAAELQEASRYYSVPLVATGDIFYHSPARKPLQDVLSCIKNGCTINQAGYLLSQNAERYLKPPEEMCRIFRDMPEAVKRTLQIAQMCAGFSLEQLRYEYPDEICPSGKTPQSYLSELTWLGAHERYPRGIPLKVTQSIDNELLLISELDYEKYFLTCYAIVKFARSKGILCQGRGAAANSAVCYCLGITAVDPDRIDLLFARFVSKERHEPPDIDIDFEHERREEVIQYIYEKYGRDRAGLTCEVITYQPRSAVRDTGKALGLSLEEVDKIAKSIHRWTACAVTEQELRELGFDPQSAVIKNAFTLAKELIGFPRHLSQHVGGFIISEKALSETVPIRNAAMPNRTMIEWDKDDIEVLGMLKIDVLGLGMLSCIRKALQYINQRRLHEGKEELKLHTIPAEDPAVYDMICAADTIGVFQIESRAQMSMLPRLKPRSFYDLVIEVAIVRPGPIQGNMVHPFLRRRLGLEKISYPDKRVEEILGKTMGVPIFQEQAMRLAIVLAKFTPGEAEKLRRAMAAWKRDKGQIAVFKEKIIRGMLANGYTVEFAETCMNQIKGFSEYGFPESHAASFALLVYASAWIKRHYPAEFAAALLNSQPMGFYAPSQIVADAKAHNVEVLAIDINKSLWDCTIESGALRLGMRLVKFLPKAEAEIIINSVRSYGEFNNIASLWNKTRNSKPHLRKAALQALARADAFSSMGLNSREAFWEIKALIEKITPLDKLVPAPNIKVALPQRTDQQAMFEDYQATGLSLKGHPIGFLRNELNVMEVSTASSLRRSRPKLFVRVAGIAIVRQRPHTAKGVVFISLEDETGITNLIIRSDIFDQYQKVILQSSTLLVRGILERVGEVLYVNVKEAHSLDERVLALKKIDLKVKDYSY